MRHREWYAKKYAAAKTVPNGGLKMKNEDIGAWIAHADHADTFCIRQALFGGWFEPVPGMRDVASGTQEHGCTVGASRGCARRLMGLPLQLFKKATAEMPLADRTNLFSEDALRFIASGLAEELVTAKP